MKIFTNTRFVHHVALTLLIVDVDNRTNYNYTERFYFFFFKKKKQNKKKNLSKIPFFSLLVLLSFSCIAESLHF